MTLGPLVAGKGSRSDMEAVKETAGAAATEIVYIWT